ncbi:Transmembrane protein [Entamoeba marina]
MQQGGRSKEKGPKKLSKKEQEALKLKKQEDLQKKEEEKQRKREEKLLGIKPDKQKKNKKLVDSVNENDGENDNYDNGEDKKSPKTRGNKLKTKKKDKKKQPKKQDNSNTETDTTTKSDTEEQHGLQEENEIIEINEEKSIENEEIIENIPYWKEENTTKKVKQTTIEFDFKSRNDNITTKFIPKEFRKKGNLNDEEKLSFLSNYFSQWDSSVDFSCYPLNNISRSDSKDLLLLLKQININKKKSFLEQQKVNVNSDGSLCFIEALMISVGITSISPIDIDIHLLQLSIKNEPYKSLSFILTHQSSMKKLDNDIHKQILTRLLKTLKKIKTADSVTAKAFTASFNIKPIEELSDLYQQLCQLPILLNKKKSLKNPAIAAQLLTLDSTAFQKWDELVGNHLQESFDLLQIVKTYDDSEMKLFCTRMIEEFNNNQKAKEFVSLCRTIVKPPINPLIYVGGGVGIVVVIVSIIIAIYLMN